MLNDFLSKLPIDVIIKTEITDDIVEVPIAIDSDEFYNEFKTEIEDNNLTNEKCIYVSSLYQFKRPITAFDLLTYRIKY